MTARGPLFANCRACVDAPTSLTRQRQLGRAVTPSWYTACDAHAPATGRFHETIALAGIALTAGPVVAVSLNVRNRPFKTIAVPAHLWRALRRVLEGVDGVVVWYDALDFYTREAVESFEQTVFAMFPATPGEGNPS